MSVSELTLDQLGTVSRGRSRHRPRDATFLYGGPYPFIQTGDVKRAGLYLRDYDQTYTEAGLAQSKLWPEGTLCITIAANIAETSILGIEACFPDSIIGFIADPDQADVRFVKYLFDATLKMRFQSFTQGTTQDNLSRSKLLSIRFPVPELSVQRKIADILSAYDDLIENNQRRVALLERMGREIYREWFVRLRFPGHEYTNLVDGLPEGWERKSLGDLVDIVKGKNITKNSSRNGPVPVVAGGLSPAYYHDTANAVGPIITISASGANAGYVNIYHEDIWASDCSYISRTSTKYLYYFYLLLSSRQKEIIGLQRGTAQPHVYPKDLKRLPLLAPSDGIVELFEKFISHKFSQIGVLQRQNRQLRRARDLLLPRLVSGEISVSTEADSPISWSPMKT